MIATTDITLAVNTILKSLYPKVKRYGIEVSEGYIKPSFFTDVRLDNRTDETANIEKKEYSCTITYLTETVDMVDNLAKVEEIQQAIARKQGNNKKKRMCLLINDRYIPVTNYHFGYTGEKNNILQISFDMELYDFSQEEEEKQLMNEIEFSERLER